MLGAHGILKEASSLIRNLEVTSQLTSDHYTNYINLTGRLPDARQRLLSEIEAALQMDEGAFRPFFIGTE
jgi:hypothetical protein